MVVTWLKHDWESRHIHASSLLKEVRLGVVPEDKPKELLDSDILEIPECKDLYDKVNKACDPGFNPSKFTSKIFPPIVDLRVYRI